MIRLFAGSPTNASTAAPSISSFSPSSGPVGTMVTILGTNLTNLTSLSFGTTNAIVISNTGSTLVGLVMPATITSTISVTTSGGLVSSASSFSITATPFPSTQQGVKQVGVGRIGIGYQGCSVSVSADGNTAAVGGYADNASIGAVFVYIRTGTTWAQQGAKLIGTGAIGQAEFGFSVSISADGNTIIAGGHNDNSSIGAVWIFTRSAGTWTQQGSKLVGTGFSGAPAQGGSVSISSDGNTAIVGGLFDNNQTGAAWIFTRSNGIWTQVGNKLVGTGGTGQQGFSVAISSDASTVIIGGNADNAAVGATWIFTQAGGVWSQQGNKLVGTGSLGSSNQGFSVALNADGNTAVVGGYADNFFTGAVWVFVRNNGVWSQQGNKLIGSGFSAAPKEGSGVAVSADGNSLIVGAFNDNSGDGASWIFTRTGTTWAQQGSKKVIPNSTFSYVGYSVAMSSDGTTALVGAVQDNSNAGAMWPYVNVGSPLAINFVSISANAYAGSIIVNWTVQDPGDCKQFIIQRSNNGIDFSNLSTINSNFSLGYNYKDAAPANGLNYYRILTSTQADQDLYSNIVKASLQQPLNQITMYPNPIKNNNVTVNLNQVIPGEYRFQIISALGSVLQSRTFFITDIDKQINLLIPQTLPNGMYELSITKPDHSSEIKTISLEK